MNILVVSDREYKKTSRGIDIITTYLAEKGHDVDHLVFFKRKSIPPKQINSNVRQLYFYDFLKFYRSRLQFLFPGFILRAYFKYIIKKQTKINFEIYDYVILESGHPVYLSLVISNKIIYRQSDPPEISFYSNRLFYNRLENHVIKKAVFALLVVQKDNFPIEYTHKMEYWHSGFVPIYFTNRKKNKSFVFMGGGKIDFLLIKKIAKQFPEYIFHIIGIFKKSRTMNNVVFHGYLEYDEYQKLVLSSSVCIIPFTKKFSLRLRRCYFTAKILLPMSLGMPILVKNYGTIQETDVDKKLFVYKTHKEALVLLDEIVKQTESGAINYDVSKETNQFLFPRTVENSSKELDRLFSNFLK